MACKTDDCHVTKYRVVGKPKTGGGQENPVHVTKNQEVAAATPIDRDCMNVADVDALKIKLKEDIKKANEAQCSKAGEKGECICIEDEGATGSTPKITNVPIEVTYSTGGKVYRAYGTVRIETQKFSGTCFKLYPDYIVPDPEIKPEEQK